MTDKNKEFWEDGSFYGEYVSEELNDERKNYMEGTHKEKT